jgi:hypothetical protein
MMSNITPQPTPPQTPPAVSPRTINIDRLVPYRRQIATGLLVLAALFAIIPVWLAIRKTLNVAIGPVFVWGLAMSLVNLILAVVGLSYTSEGKLTEAQKLRLLLLSAGGLMGLGTALLGFVLPITVYQETWAKGLDAWRARPAALIWPAAALLGGLALMFASLQLGRGMEREHQNLRRLIYGFNAVLMSILLLAVLALPNVLAYAEPFTRFFGRPYDWTATDVNSISPVMRNLLADLKELVKVYVLMPRNNAISQDTQTLLENCRSLSNNFSWELIDPRAAQNRSRVVGFMEKYAISDPTGLLVIRGTESEKTKSDHAFIKFRDLYEQDMTNRRGPLTYAYLGENALYNALLDLIEGKLVLYFTQGHGEMSLEGAMPPMPQMRGRQMGDLSTLKQRLTERKSVEVKPLTVDRSLKKVPDDANVVIVARPTQPFTPAEEKVLREYAKRPAKTRTVKDKSGEDREEVEVTPGKLMLLFSPVIQKQNDNATMAPTGLEGLLAEHNVKLGNDRILTVSRRDPLDVVAVTNPKSPNPVAKAFNPDRGQQTVFLFHNCRTVEPLADKPGGGFAAEQLMMVPKQYGFWAETNLNRDPVRRAEAVRDNEELQDKLFGGKPLCIAVAVSESAGGGAPRDMAHAGLIKETPRMVVFGAAEWIGDDALAGGGATRLDLFNSLISWVREKSSIGKKIEPKKRKEYELGIAPQDAGRLVWLPLGLMLLGVIGVGTGVWVVRRK